MKTQYSFLKRWFTLLEIMVVIAIIWIIFGIFSQINFRSQENLTKSERLANRLQSLIHSTNVAVMMGRMDQSSIAITGATITLGSSGSTTHGMRWRYTDSLSGSIMHPFFDGDPFYEIVYIRGCNATQSWTVNTAEIIFDRESISFSGFSLSPAPFLLEMRVRYVDMSKTFIFDRRTGRTEVLRWWLTQCP